jgi:hypothetical protein
MRNFLKIAEGIEVNSLLHVLACNEKLWNQYTVRTAHPRSAHRVVDDILLRYSPFNTGDDFIEKVCSEIHVVTYPAWYKLPHFHPIIFGLLAKVYGVHLGRVMISRMAPGVEIPEHSDRITEAETLFPTKIPPAVYYQRYQLALQSEPGTVFSCGDESVHMKPGEIWWFNNNLPHSVQNGSGNDRISLICDIRTQHDDYLPS